MAKIRFLKVSQEIDFFVRERQVSVDSGIDEEKSVMELIENLVKMYNRRWPHSDLFSDKYNQFVDELYEIIRNKERD